MVRALIGENRHPRGHVIKYNFQDETGMLYYMTPNEVKEAMMSGIASFPDFKITSDGKLIKAHRYIADELKNGNPNLDKLDWGAIEKKNDINIRDSHKHPTRVRLTGITKNQNVRNGYQIEYVDYASRQTNQASLDDLVDGICNGTVYVDNLTALTQKLRK